MRNWNVLGLVIFTFIFMGCEQKSEKSEGQIAPPKNSASSEKMKSTLAELIKNINPMIDYTANSKMAGMMEQRAQQINNPPQKNALLFQAAEQWLNAGQTEKAIGMIERLIKESNLQEKYNDPNGRALYNKLGLCYLRLGEQKNCIQNHTPSNCILPLQAEGYHTDKLGSEKAIEIFTNLLKYKKDDKSSIWLLNVAYMTLGKYPQEVPREYLIKNKINEIDDFPRFLDVASASGVDALGLSGGVCIEDFDNDGDLDIMASSYGLADQVKYFERVEDKFIDRTASSGLLGTSGGLNMIHADYDNDGDADVLLLRGGWLRTAGNHPNSLLENLGNNKFQDVTFDAGLNSKYPTQTACWFDVDLDGDLDLFIGNELNKKEKNPSELYINNGDKSFTESAAKHGCRLFNFVKGVISTDFNNDGWPDLYLSCLGQNNISLINNKGKFVNASAAMKIEKPIQSFPVWSWDVNNDGYDDLLVNSYEVSKENSVIDYYLNDIGQAPLGIESPKLYINDTKGGFTESSEKYGLDKLSSFAMGSNFGDLDNDGWLDFYLGTGSPNLRSIIPNRMFRNQNGNKFKEVTSSGGFGHIQKGHGVAFADLDRDGDQDVYAVMGGAFEGDTYQNTLYQNPAKDLDFIIIKLTGQSSNRSAIGAKIILSVIDRSGNKRNIYRTINTGGSFGSDPLQAHFGLENVERIESCRVIWPNKERTKQDFKELKKNSLIRITEADEQIKYEDYTPMPFNLEGGNHHHHHHH